MIKPSFGYNRTPSHAIFHIDPPNPEAAAGGTAVESAPPPAAPTPTETPQTGNSSGDPKSPDYFTQQSRSDALKNLFENSKGESKDKSGKSAPAATVTPPPAKTQPAAPSGLEFPNTSKPQIESIPELESLAPKNPKDVQGFKAIKERTEQIVHAEREKSRQYERSLGEAKIKFDEERAAFQKQLEQLKGFQVAADIHSDPDFQAKYLRPIETHQVAIKNILKGIGAKDEAINALRMDDTAELLAIAQGLTEKGYTKEAAIVQQKINRIAELEADRDVEVNESKSKWKEITQQKAISGQTKQAEYKTKVSAHIEALSKSKTKEGAPEYAVLNELQVPPDANDEQRKQIEAHNSLVRDSKDKILYFSTVDDPKTRTDIALGCIMGNLLDRAYTNLSRDHEALQKEFERVTNAAPKPKGRPQSTSTENSAPKVDMNMNATQALQARFGVRRG